MPCGAKFPGARIVWSPVIDMTTVPALPPLLARILEIRAQAINAMGTRLCHERGAVPASRLPVEDPARGFSTDGFHASEAGYRAWAEHLLPLIELPAAEALASASVAENDRQ
jgi:lysophospholipase L1-like esterase